MMNLMKTITFPPYIVLLFALLLVAPLPAAADNISKQQAVSIAQQVSPGRVLGVKMRGGSYRVKTLSTSGEVRIIVIDANSGKVKSGKSGKSRKK